MNGPCTRGGYLHDLDIIPCDLDSGYAYGVAWRGTTMGWPSAGPVPSTIVRLKIDICANSALCMRLDADSIHASTGSQHERHIIRWMERVH